MDSNADTYHFRIDDEDPFRGVLEAVQFVKGRDALEIEPIGRAVDPDALDELVTGSSGVTVSFTVDDLDVEVTSNGDIYIADPTPESFIHESVADASNVLLQAESHEHEACVDLLSVEPYDEEVLLGVLHAESFESRVAAWEQYMEDRPAETAAINVGDFPRSSTAASAGGATRVRTEPFSYVQDASDLSELEATITDRLSALERDDRQLVVCFDSITTLLRNVPDDRATEFLRTVTEQMADADAVAHYHFDPEPCSAASESRIRSLFDSAVTVNDDGDWTVR